MDLCRWGTFDFDQFIGVKISVFHCVSLLLRGYGADIHGIVSFCKRYRNEKGKEIGKKCRMNLV